MRMASRLMSASEPSMREVTIATGTELNSV
jgi:hypothetical protein